MFSICDWYETFARLAGVDTSSLSLSNSDSIPGIDSLDIWPLITGSNLTSPRTEIPLSSVDLKGSAFISGDFKIVLGTQGGKGIWTGPQSPNETEQYEDTIGCPDGCLFNITKDPTEHEDLSQQFPEIKEAMMARHIEISETMFQTDCYGQTVHTNIAAVCASFSKINGVWAPYGFCLSDGSMPKCYYIIAGIIAALGLLLFCLCCIMVICFRRRAKRNEENLAAQLQSNKISVDKVYDL